MLREPDVETRHLNPGLGDEREGHLLRAREIAAEVAADVGFEGTHGGRELRTAVDAISRECAQRRASWLNGVLTRTASTASARLRLRPAPKRRAR